MAELDDIVGRRFDGRRDIESVSRMTRPTGRHFERRAARCEKIAQTDELVPHGG
jgi:hypothetical protein